MNKKLRLENIRKTASNKGKILSILKDISADIGTGDIFTIVGPSGSGKSTLLRLMNRLSDPTAGRILLDGIDTKSINVLSLRRRVGMVFQSPVVFEGTVRDNIQYAEKLAGAKVDVITLIHRVGLTDDFLDRYAQSLSGGEQQRVSIARSLATQPEVLLMDEPTSALDPNAKTQIEDLVLRMNHDDGLTIVFVTHDMDQARRIGNRTMLLIDGNKVEEAPTEQFFNEPQTEAARLFINGKLAQ